MSTGRLQDEYFDQKMETAPREDLERIQWRSLRNVVRYGYDNCAFYHKKWKEVGVLPDDIQTIRDFQTKIPVFTKDDLRRESSTDDITAGITSCPEHDLSSYAMTSGTTGINTFLGLSAAFLDEFTQRHAMREYWMARMRPRMRVLLLPAGWHFFGIAQNMVLTKMGATCLSPWGTLFHRFVPQVFDAVRNLHPDYIVALPWVVSALMEESENAGMEPRQLFKGVKYMSLAGQAIPDALRKRIADETDVIDVFESGGSCDGLWGGSDCFAHEGHHIWMESNFLEMIDLTGRDLIEDGNESRGRLVSTNLTLGGPLYVRFLGEDLVQMFRGICDCGRTHQRVELYDRLSNTIRIKSRLITPYDVGKVLEKVLGSRLFTIVNPVETSEKLRVKVSKGQEKENLESLNEQVRELSKNELGVEIELELVDIKTLPFVHRKYLQVIDEKESKGGNA